MGDAAADGDGMGPVLPMAFLVLHVAIFVNPKRRQEQLFSAAAIAGAALMCAVAADQSSYISMVVIGVWVYAMAAGRLPVIPSPQQSGTRIAYLSFYALGALSIYSGFQTVATYLNHEMGLTGRFMSDGVAPCAARLIGAS